MRKNRMMVAGAVLAGFSSGGVAQAQTIPTQSSSGLTTSPGGIEIVTLDGPESGLETNCRERPVLVTSSKSIFLIRNFCSQLTVRGDDDVIRIELAPGALITFLGKNNKVTYQVDKGGKDAIVRDPDHANHVVRIGNLQDLPGGPRAGLLTPGKNGGRNGPAPTGE